MKQKAKFHLLTGTNAVLIIIVLALLNLTSYNLFGRLDLSSNRLFSLSPVSKDLAAKLDDKLDIKCYFTENLPPPYNTIPRYIKDKLEEYRAYSHGYLKYEFIDPAKNPKLEEELTNLRIPFVKMQVRERDRAEVKKIYMAMVFTFADRQQVLPVITSPVGLEYDITRTIKKLLYAEKKNIGILVGHGEPDPKRDLSELTNELQNDYSVMPVQLSRDRELNQRIDALLIISPLIPLQEWEKFRIDQYIMHGGKVAFALDRINVNFNNMTSSFLNTGFDDFLAHYGISLTHFLVLDTQNRALPMEQRRGDIVVRSAVPYPFFTRVTNFNQEQVAVKNLQLVHFFYPFGLQINTARQPNVKAEPLAFSSNKIKLMSPPYNADPFVRYDFAQFNQPAALLAAVLKGKFNSFYADRPLSEIAPEENVKMLKESQETRIIVIANGRMAQNQFLGTEGNKVFLSNIVDWLTQDEALISIRTKFLDVRPLKEVSGGMKSFIKYANMVAPALLVIAIGLVFWQVRRFRRPRQ